MQKKAIVLFAEGFEEVEALTPVDYLRRAGIEVICASIGSSNIVTGARKIQVITDAKLDEIFTMQNDNCFDAVIIPGGMPGSANLAASKNVNAFLNNFAVTGKWICAICAAPAVVLAPLGLLHNRKFTCYPGMEEKVKDGIWTDAGVVIDDSGLISARSAGYAGHFAIAIISKLLSEAESQKVAQAVIL
jgi:4-methyl-5(b-hydroxyethyl)-thiazole monophosphate biosynthesis